MSTQQISVEGIVLKKIEKSGSNLHFYIFTKKFGILLCIKRIPKKKISKLNPDLFDIAILDLDRIKTSEIWFIRDYRLIKSNSSISNYYKSFVYAAEYSNFLINNLKYIESFERFYELTLKAIYFWSNGAQPESVFIKTIYLLARDEGYPVKQDWINSLNRRNKILANDIIFNRINDHNLDESNLISLLQSIKNWLKYNTDFLVK